MTVPEFIAELEHWKREARLYKEQMEVNNDYCQSYKNQLITIAKLVGWKEGCGFPDMPSLPEESALRLVEEFVKNNTKDTP